VKSAADALNFEKSNGTKPEVASGAAAAEKGAAGSGSSGDAGRAATGATGGTETPAPAYRYDDAT
jgi:hypothetical protein